MSVVPKPGTQKPDAPKPGTQTPENGELTDAELNKATGGAIKDTVTQTLQIIHQMNSNPTG
jgi:hypothetical protein